MDAVLPQDCHQTLRRDRNVTSRKDHSDAPSEHDLPRGEVEDQALLFTLEEFEQAARFIMPPEEARERASHAHHPVPDPAARKQPSYISSDMLDLLAMVSDSCAKRVAKIWGVTPEEAEARRAAIAREYGLAP